MENINEINSLQADIQRHKDFSMISKAYAEGLWEIHTSNALFFNYFLKKERVTTFHVLMCYIFSCNKSSLSDFYSLCSEKKFSGKNNAIKFLDYLEYAGIVMIVKMSDRRRKKVVLTEKGRGYLNHFTLKTLTPLAIYDSEIDCNLLLIDGFFRAYYSNKNINECISWKVDLNFNYIDKPQLLEIQSKSGGFIFLMKILLDIRNGMVKVGEEIKSLFFSNLSREIGISLSQVQNLVTLMVDGGFIERRGGSYRIKDGLLKGIEYVISQFLASDYYFIRDFLRMEVEKDTPTKMAIHGLIGN
jgi:DNA-binding MarR family transcriptional regulator